MERSLGKEPSIVKSGIIARGQGLVIFFSIAVLLSYLYENGILPSLTSKNSLDASAQVENINPSSAQTSKKTSSSRDETEEVAAQIVMNQSPQSDGVSAKVGVIEKVRELSGAGETLSAVALLEDSLKTDPNNISLLMELGVISVLDLKQPDRAQKIFEKIIALDPSQRGALNELILLYEEQGRVQEGADFLASKLVEATDNTEIQYAYAKLLAKSGRSAEALDSFEAATSLRDIQDQVYLDLADAAMGLGRYEKALPAYESAIRLQEAEVARSRDRQGESLDFIEDRLVSSKVAYIRALLRAGRVSDASTIVDALSGRDDDPVVVSVRREVASAVRM